MSFAQGAKKYRGKKFCPARKRAGHIFCDDERCYGERFGCARDIDGKKCACTIWRGEINMPQSWQDEQGGVAVEKETREKIDKPRMWKILLHNDNYTTMDFVVLVLVSVFHKKETEAIRIMLDVHRKGIGVVGTYTYAIAETKVARVTEMARQAEYPLMCTMEPE